MCGTPPSTLSFKGTNPMANVAMVITVAHLLFVMQLTEPTPKELTLLCHKPTPQLLCAAVRQPQHKVGHLVLQAGLCGCATLWQSEPCVGNMYNRDDVWSS